MRATIIVFVALIAAFLVAQFGAASADSCSDRCDSAYAACSKSCKDTDCYTKCLNDRGSCVAKCQ